MIKVGNPLLIVLRTKKDFNFSQVVSATTELLSPGGLRSTITSVDIFTEDETITVDLDNTVLTMQGWWKATPIVTLDNGRVYRTESFRFFVHGVDD